MYPGEGVSEAVARLIWCWRRCGDLNSRYTPEESGDKIKVVSATLYLEDDKALQDLIGNGDQTAQQILVEWTTNGLFLSISPAFGDPDALLDWMKMEFQGKFPIEAAFLKRRGKISDAQFKEWLLKLAQADKIHLSKHPLKPDTPVINFGGNKRYAWIEL